MMMPAPWWHDPEREHVELKQRTTTEEVDQAVQGVVPTTDNT